MKIAVYSLGLLALIGCAPLPVGRALGQAREEATPTPIPAPVVPTKPTYEVQRGEVVKQLEFTGRIAPVVQATLFFAAGGRVRDVFVAAGDPVTAGQLLAELEIDDLQRELAAAQREQESAQARLDARQRQVAYDLRRAEANLEIARLRLEQW